MATKKEIRLKQFLQIVTKYKGNLVSSDLCKTYEFETLVGTLRVTEHDSGFDFIPMIFRENFDLNSFLGITFDHSINKNSFKWNLHSSDEKFNLDRLERRLEMLVELKSN